MKNNNRLAAGQDPSQAFRAHTWMVANNSWLFVQGACSSLTHLANVDRLACIIVSGGVEVGRLRRRVKE